MKHTPGPWTVNTATDSFGWVNHAINWGRNYGDEQNQANGVLIAAAPELLDTASGSSAPLSTTPRTAKPFWESTP